MQRLRWIIAETGGVLRQAIGLLASAAGIGLTVGLEAAGGPEGGGGLSGAWLAEGLRTYRCPWLIGRPSVLRPLTRASGMIRSRGRSFLSQGLRMCRPVSGRTISPMVCLYSPRIPFEDRSQVEEIVTSVLQELMWVCAMGVLWCIFREDWCGGIYAAGLSFLNAASFVIERAVCPD